jgi:hypothetical protein
MPYEEKAGTSLPLPVLDKLAAPGTSEAWFGFVDVEHPHEQSP